MKEEYIFLSLLFQKIIWYIFLNVIIYMLSFVILKGVLFCFIVWMENYVFRDEVCCQYLFFMLQVFFDFIDFFKDFLEGKIDFEENFDKDEVC